MTTATDNPFPPLFSHTLRKEWGVGILASENDGKHRYLFESGEERTLASGFHDMMRKVEKPSPEQQAAYARLRGMLAARAPTAGTVKPGGLSFVDQLRTFHEGYPAGLSDPKWVEDVRGDGAPAGARRHRQATIREAQELLSVQSLDALLAGPNFAQVWDHVVKVLSGSDLVPAAQLKLRAPREDQRRALGASIRELLYGTVSYDVRFDRFVAAFIAAFGAPPRWELATALSAVVHPTNHVGVEPISFRKQLKAGLSRRAVGTQPSGTGYASFLGAARLVASKLGEHGEVPRDLMDARDFIVFTLKAVPKKKAPKPAKKAEPAPEVEAEAETEED